MRRLGKSIDILKVSNLYLQHCIRQLLIASEFVDAVPNRLAGSPYIDGLL